MSPLILNGTPARPKQLLQPPLVLTASTKCVGGEVHDLKVMVVEEDAVVEVTVVIVEAGVKVDIEAVVVDIEVIAAEEREDIAGVAEADGEIVAVAMLNHSEIPTSRPSATTSNLLGSGLHTFGNRAQRFRSGNAKDLLVSHRDHRSWMTQDLFEKSVA